jgi:ribosomal protein S18 acetylase RimI-like enzyme
MAMARLEVVPFSDTHLEDAGRLLAARHKRQRQAEPLLPERFEDQGAAHDEVVKAWRAEDASGAAALRAGRLVGYLIGAPRDPEAWGENVWVDLAGHAVEEAEDIRDLYATAAARWFDEERRRHYALVPANDSELVDAWFRLGFGHQQGHGIREVPPQTDVLVPEGFEIREPREEDIEELVPIDLALPTHQGSSPVFSTRPLPTADVIREEWRKTLAGDEERLLIGVLDGKPVACWSVCAAELSSHYSGLGLPDHACYLAFASTLPETRGSGIGVALTEASLAAAAADGFSAMVTDWRVTNLLASRFWPKRGFRPAFFRLYRSIP